MGTSLNIQLTKELRRFVDERASDDDVYSTPSEYVRDLIRRDMERRDQTRARQIASALTATLGSPVVALEKNLFDIERKRLKARSATRASKVR